jgi:hypothetical protein
LRVASFAIGICSISVTYFIGKKIYSKQLGLISAFFIAINFFHIENSTVVMREIFTLILSQIFFLLLLYTNNKNILIIFLIGLLSGYISISTGIWPLYIIIYFTYILIELKKVTLKFFIIYAAGFFITSFVWLYITKSYFGKFYYSNLNYYPYVNHWAQMMFDRGLPSVDQFWREININEYLYKHFFWFIKNLYFSSLVLTPTFVFFLFFSFFPICFFGAYKLKFRGYILLLFTIIYFLGLSYGSYALDGKLAPRHFLPLLSSTTILLAAGVIPFFNYIQKRIAYINYQKIIYLIFFLSFCITIIGIKVKTSFWEKDTHNFYEFGNKINKLTNKDEVIMYSVAVPDLWCSTKRNIVHDIARSGSVSKQRLKLEIEKYNVSYIFIDISSNNYEYSREVLLNLLNNYRDLDLKLTLADESNGYFFYKILKK